MGTGYPSFGSLSQEHCPIFPHSSSIASYAGWVLGASHPDLPRAPQPVTVQRAGGWAGDLPGRVLGQWCGSRGRIVLCTPSWE